MRVAIEGCTHGELDQIYATIKEIEDMEGYKVDVLICCGDFQSTRNLSDLKTMACPDKYKSMCSFYKYYSGEAIAPLLTIFIGGNHEASNYLQELAYGGWVAPNIYYLGYAGVINVNGVRIGGLSGIFKGNDYLFGHFEKPPYDDRTMRSCYHVRNVDVFRLKQLEGNSPDIMLSHDWPRSVTDHGDVDQLVRFKKFLKDDIEQNKLGSPPAWEILETLQPSYWFSGHLHCKFAALVEHESGKETRFLALDKCLPGRQFLQILEVGEPVVNDEIIVKYDKHWLAVLKNTDHLLSVERKNRYTPGPGCSERYDFRPTSEELEEIETLFNGDFEIPYNFEQGALSYKATPGRLQLDRVTQPQATVNKQTTELCGKLSIQDPMALLIGRTPRTGGNFSTNSFSRSASNSFVNDREDNVSLYSSSFTNSDVLSTELDENSENGSGGMPESPEDSNLEADDSKNLEEEDKAPRAPMSIPAPKLDSSDVDLSSVLNTSEESNVFVIDTHGDSEPSGEDVAKSPMPTDVKPATASPAPKKLKRRNASMYSTSDD